MSVKDSGFSNKMAIAQAKSAIDNDKLIKVLTEISNMCIGNISMNYSLDAQYIGDMIYEATGLTNPELNDLLRE